MPKPKRQVEIVNVFGVWAVAFVERRKHQHYWAAQFDAKDHTLEQVKEWVATNRPDLEVIE